MIANGEQLNFNVRLLDPDLQEFFPDGVIRYSGANGFEQLNDDKNNIAQSLIKKVGEAVNQQHLKQSPGFGLISTK